MSIKINPTNGKTVPLEVVPRGTSLHQFAFMKTKSTDREDYDDPFYVMDVKRLADLYQLWRESLPSIKPYYAVKCNEDPVLLSLLSHLGTGFDCASKGEISRLLEMGVSPGDIIFANPCKQTSHIKYAARKGISLVTFDNEMELHKMATHHSNAKLVVRICADDPTARCQLGVKFGCSVTDACSMLHVAKHLQLQVIGVSFHVGSGCQTPDAYRVALEMAHEVFEYADTVGYHFNFLDIGGGFPGSDTELALFQEVASTINLSIGRLFSDRHDLNIIAEPGRYFASSCFSLAVQVTSKRVTSSSPSSENESFMYYVNDGVYGSFNCLIYDHAIVQPRVLENSTITRSSNSTYSCSIWGPTCDSLDKICTALLPEVTVGDWIQFEDMGAYTISGHSSFNGFVKPKVFYCLREEDKESFEDVFMNLLTSRVAVSLPSLCETAIQNTGNSVLAVVATELKVTC
ncbi:PREDICTED: ornithine decarboxylase-like [Amphimedon queenslandica]|uniref:ornithine decarboxylase n=1 Tax=Amphimedon queenslandica TaxID=400682 RepID=A0A1X7UH07_AMPQE|nr:PREDICTED: ornithine decarboxylase-like [Amphimedon queenslandica]|eukprot:XP_011405033.2 PREDICTED: ornithine decarboxylase-like [Amphimedon queenslandica]